MLTAADLQPQAAFGIHEMADALEALRNGQTYLNVHTTRCPGGEIRGQIGPATFRARMDGAQTDPPIDTRAVGSATLQLNATQTEITVTVETQQVCNATGIHIHWGAVGDSGPELFDLLPACECTSYTGLLCKTVGPADFLPRREVHVNTFDDAVNALLSGHTYLNIHFIEGNPLAIRGHLLP